MYVFSLPVWPLSEKLYSGGRGRYFRELPKFEICLQPWSFIGESLLCGRGRYFRSFEDLGSSTRSMKCVSLIVCCSVLEFFRVKRPIRNTAHICVQIFAWLETTNHLLQLGHDKTKTWTITPKQSDLLLISSTLLTY